jgi:site-specific DNA recombinase
LQGIKGKIRAATELYEKGKLDADGFGELYGPLNEQKKQIEAALPRIEAELDILKVNSLSAGEIASQAGSLYDRWLAMPPNEKREIVEIITDKIVISKDEITISLSYAPSCKDMADRWRKGWDSNPR